MGRVVLEAPEMPMRTLNPTIAVIGSGGAGINLINKLSVMPITSRLEKIYAVDTSASNVVNDKNIMFKLIANTGSGKVRQTHLDKVQHAIAIDKDLVPSDINIFIFSSSGGSGSVIGPLLARKFAMAGKAIVMFMVVDDCSGLDTINSINTIRTLENISNKDNLYTPMMIFQNSRQYARQEIDESVLTQLYRLIDMLTCPSVAELDFNDKMNFLRPNSINCGDAGIYHIGISDTYNGQQAQQLKGEVSIKLGPNTRVHTSMTISQVGTPVNIMSNAAFVGLSKDVGYTSVIGVPIDTDFITQLTDSHDKFKTGGSHNKASAPMFDVRRVASPKDSEEYNRVVI